MSGSGRDRGNILLTAILLITIVSLVLAMAVQPVQTANQRVKERELIYRGEHLAEGLRRFYADNGRFPFELEELLDSDRRYVRRLYRDPMTNQGEWTLVYLTPGDLNAVKLLNSATRRLLGAEETEVNSANVDERSPGLRGGAQSAFRVKTRQITGVRSTSNEEGLTIRQDSRIYSDWLFSALPDPGGVIDSLLRATPNKPVKNYGERPNRPR